MNHHCKTCPWWDGRKDLKIHISSLFNLAPGDRVGACRRHPPFHETYPVTPEWNYCAEHPDYIRDREDDFLRRYIRMLDDKRHLDATYELIESKT